MMCFGPGTGNYPVSGECVVTAPFPSGLGRALYISWSSQSFLGTVTYLGCWYCALEVVQLPWSWPPFSPFTVEICATARQRKCLTHLVCQSDHGPDEQQTGLATNDCFPDVHIQRMLSSGSSAAVRQEGGQAWESSVMQESS